MLKNPHINKGLLALLVVWLAACGVLPGSQVPPTAVDVTAILEATHTLAAPPTEAPATAAPPTPAPATPVPGVLPAPLYFIAASDGQLWRVERDGATVTQITHEAQPVLYYDVSPADGSLVYVSGNALIRAAADGSGRTVLVTGPAFNEDNRVNNEVLLPHFSPDGSRIAFGLGGVQLIDAAGGEPHMLIPSDPVPDPMAGRPDRLLYFYRQGIWSPDGAKLLLEFYHYPEGSGWAVLPLNSDAAPIELRAEDNTILLCCYPAWSPDSSWIYFANDTFGLVSAGLWRADAATGVVETLVNGMPDENTFQLFHSARLLNDGGAAHLYYFAATVNEFPMLWPTPLTMHRAAPDGSGAAPLRTDAFGVGEALWAADGSGAAVMAVNENSQWPLHGVVQWVPAGDSAPVSLPADGAALRWGSAGS